jgi:hypothetical protein
VPKWPNAPFSDFAKSQHNCFLQSQLQLNDLWQSFLSFPPSTPRPAVCHDSAVIFLGGLDFFPMTPARFVWQVIGLRWKGAQETDGAACDPSFAKMFEEAAETSPAR